LHFSRRNAVCFLYLIQEIKKYLNRILKDTVHFLFSRVVLGTLSCHREGKTSLKHLGETGIFGKWTEYFIGLKHRVFCRLRRWGKSKRDTKAGFSLLGYRILTPRSCI